MTGGVLRVCAFTCSQCCAAAGELLLVPAHNGRTLPGAIGNVNLNSLPIFGRFGPQMRFGW
jgi:hypothetical protein